MIKRKIFLIAIVGLVCLYGLTKADNLDELFFKANKYYADGNYSMAVSLYEEIVSKGVKSGNLYYNLGNTYFKLGQGGRALLNYERAKKMLVNDNDLFANYIFVKSVLDIKQIEENILWYEKIYMVIRDVFSTKTWFVSSVVLFYLICILLGTAIFSFSFRKTASIFSGILGICFFISIVLFTKSYSAWNKVQRGIVVVQKTEVRYSPSYSGVVGFEILEGMSVQVLKSEGDWSHIRFNRKSSGWIESEAIEKI